MGEIERLRSRNDNVWRHWVGLIEECHHSCVLMKYRLLYGRRQYACQECHRY